MTLNVHGYQTSSEITAYYDIETHDARLNLYPHHVTARAESDFSHPDGRRIYHLELTHLDPGRVYHGILADQGRPLGSAFSFRTIPQDGEPLFFVEGGDWENSVAAVELAAKAASLNPMAILLGGDYPSHVFGMGGYKKWDFWLDVYTKHLSASDGRLIPLVLAIGNHEVIGGFGQSKSQSPFYFRYFAQAGLGKSYFSLSFGKDVRLYVLDSGHVTEHGGEQQGWLENELKKASNVPVKMALYHVPLFPSVRFAEKNVAYHSLYGIVKCFKGKEVAEKLYSKEAALGRYHWLPLFDAYGMTVAFEHHDQALKRTKLLRFGKQDPNGTLYLGDGGWGSHLQYSPIQGFFHHYFAALQGGQHFFWTVKIDREVLTYEAVTASGKVIDRFVQKKLF